MKSRMFLVIVIMIKVFKFFKSNLQKLVRNTSKNKQPTTNNEKKKNEIDNIIMIRILKV